MKANFNNMSESYVTPDIQVAEIVAEGVLCSSFAAPDWSYDEDLLY